MDADKSVEVTFNCQTMDIPKPVAPLDPSYECAIIKATAGFEIAPGNDVTFEAETSIELGADGPGAEFKVGAGGTFKAVMP